MRAQERKLDTLFHALADTTRRSILLQVRDQEKTVNEIASQFRISLPAVSKHLGILEDAGLITRRKEGRKRICMAEPHRLDAATKWLEFYLEFWDDRLEQLKQFIEKKN